MLSGSDLDRLRKAFLAVAAVDRLGPLYLARLDVAVGRTDEPATVAEAIEAFAPDEGWATDIGARSRVKAFWDDSPDGRWNEIEGRLLDGEFAALDGASYATRSLSLSHGGGWTIQVVTPAHRMPARLGALALEPRYRNAPFLIERARLLSVWALGDGRGGEPKHLRYRVAWQADADGPLSPRFQMFDGFVLPHTEVAA